MAERWFERAFRTHLITPRSITVSDLCLDSYRQNTLLLKGNVFCLNFLRLTTLFDTTKVAQ